jgi:hypothetical protein
MLHRVYLAWMGFDLTALVVIGTDCIGSCKSNYHMITATTAPTTNKGLYSLSPLTINGNVFFSSIHFIGCTVVFTCGNFRVLQSPYLQIWEWLWCLAPLSTIFVVAMTFQLHSKSGADPGFQVRGGGALFVWKITILRQKIIFFPNCGGRCENFWGISCEKSYFFQF